MKLKYILLTLIISTHLVGCYNIFTGGGRKEYLFEKMLKNATGQDHTIVKHSNLVSGYVVVKNEVTGEYTAYNFDRYNHFKMKSLSDYMAKADSDDVVRDLVHRPVTTHHEDFIPGHYEENSYQEYDQNTGQYYTVYQSNWVDSYTHIYDSTEHFYDGGGFTFAENTAQSKDLEGLGAAAEELNTQAVTNNIISQFGLSEDRAETLANLAVNYAKLNESRSLTDADKEIFAKQALDVSYADLEKAYKKSAMGAGDQDYDSLISKAAKANGTSPEKARALMSLYFGAQE